MRPADGEDNLACDPAGVAQLVRHCGLLQREGRVDDRTQRAGLHQLSHREHPCLVGLDEHQLVANAEFCRFLRQESGIGEHQGDEDAALAQRP